MTQHHQIIIYIYLEDITCPRMDMNFIFEWSTRYLTSERSERVRYLVDHIHKRVCNILFTCEDDMLSSRVKI